MGKSVLVTGAGGFIGSHLTERLVREGYQVRAFIRYNGRDDRGWLDDLPKTVRDSIEVHRGDLKDSESVRRAVRGQNWIFHLGASIAIPYSYQNPTDVAQINVIGTLNVLNACREESALERVVLTSTSEVYGTAQVVPIEESHPLQPQSPYSASKIAADALGESYYRSFELPVAILRPFNTYGPRQSARAIIPAIISQALTQPVLRLGSLDPKRDLTYVEDTVSGFLQIAQCDRALGRAVNIGQGTDVSIGDLVRKIGVILGKELAVETDPQRLRPAKSEVHRLVAGTRLAQELWGWSPRVSLEEGLRLVVDWIQNHPERFRSDLYVT